VRTYADQHPGTLGQGGWTDETASGRPAGPLVALAVLAAGEAAALPAAVHVMSTLPGWWRDLGLLVLLAPGAWAMRTTWVLGEVELRHLRAWHVLRALTGRGLPHQVSGLPGPTTWDDRHGRYVRNTDYRPWDVTPDGGVEDSPECSDDDGRELAPVIPLGPRIAS
jgi:hypothetical protein